MVGDEIGVAIELVDAEVKQLVRQLMEVPSVKQVREVEGASYGAAAQYSYALRSAMTRAAKQAELLRDELENKYLAVRAALDALSEQEHVTLAEFEEAVAGALESTEPAAGSGAPAPAASPTAKGGLHK